jgi:hypothetical protein
MPSPERDPGGDSAVVGGDTPCAATLAQLWVGLTLLFFEFTHCFLQLLLL